MSSHQPERLEKHRSAEYRPGTTRTPFDPRPYAGKNRRGRLPRPCMHTINRVSLAPADSSLPPYAERPSPAPILVIVPTLVVLWLHPNRCAVQGKVPSACYGLPLLSKPCLFFRCSMCCDVSVDRA